MFRLSPCESYLGRSRVQAFGSVSHLAAARCLVKAFLLDPGDVEAVHISCSFLFFAQVSLAMTY
jgi:hypothetical protein